MAKTILITGANGQLGTELQLLLKERELDYEVLATDVDTLDLTDAGAVDRCFDARTIDFVVNCAAFTAVDRAESAADLCRRVNVDAPANLARAAARVGARMVHISTDYVFDGSACTPYRETDAPAPVTVYGTTKLEGERQVMALCPEAVILRTAWLYSPHGNNFVKTMLKLGRERDSLRVVVDQVGTPTSATDLAGAILTIIRSDRWTPGIYHFSDEGAVSWYDFAVAALRLAGIHTPVAPCLTDEFPTPACRPHYSVLDKSLIKATYALTIPHWHTSLTHVIARLQPQQP